MAAFSASRKMTFKFLRLLTAGIVPGLGRKVPPPASRPSTRRPGGQPRPRPTRPRRPPRGLGPLPLPGGPAAGRGAESAAALTGLRPVIY